VEVPMEEAINDLLDPTTRKDPCFNDGVRLQPKTMLVVQSSKWSRRKAVGDGWTLGARCLALNMTPELWHLQPDTWERSEHRLKLFKTQASRGRGWLV